MKLLREPSEITKTPIRIQKDRRSFLHRIIGRGAPKIVLETPFIEKEIFRTVLIEQTSTSIFDKDRLQVGQRVEAVLLNGYMIFGLEPVKQKKNVFECRYDYYKII